MTSLKPYIAINRLSIKELTFVYRENLANVLREPNNEDVVLSALNTLPWTSEQVQDLQTATLSESQSSFCVLDKNVSLFAMIIYSGEGLSNNGLYVSSLFLVSVL